MSWSRLIRSVTILGVRKDRALVDERLQTRAVQRRKAIDEVGPHLIDGEHKDQLWLRRRRRNGRRLREAGRRATEHGKQSEEVSAHDFPDSNVKSVPSHRSSTHGRKAMAAGIGAGPRSARVSDRAPAGLRR